MGRDDSPDRKASLRKASAGYHAKRKAEGWRKVTVWLDPATAAKVDALKHAAGSADEVHRQAIGAWMGPGAPPALRPVAAPKAKPAAGSGKSPGPAPKAKTSSSGSKVKVQLGPTAPKAGSRLKRK